MIITTTENISGYHISEVIGLVQGQENHRGTAKENIAEEAALLGADAVVAVRGLYVPESHLLNLIGTAVKLETAER